MKNTTRRVVILKDVNSDSIEQAILILKDGVKENDSALLCEAEKIVEKYMGKKCGYSAHQKKPSATVILSLGAALISIGMVIIAFFV